MPAWKELLLRWLLKPLKAWELRAARRPDYYIANSRVVAERLHRAFGVNSVVIPPPIETSRFHISDKMGDYFLVVSRLVPYKRIDLAVLACTQLGVRLIVIGDGPDRARLEALAGPTITFAGRASDAEVNDYASRCQALLFPGEEDFGMTPLEVNAAGRPVIAYKGGGAAETITEGLNGIFFNEPTAESLQDAITRFQQLTWDSQRIRERAMEFDIATFQQRILEFVVSKLPRVGVPKA
jgi:glycosyltransferase involved in cell wall biosynthesis